MAKYSKQHLMRMARVVQQARETASERYQIFVMMVAIRAMRDTHTVEQKIREYANG